MLEETPVPGLGGAGRSRPGALGRIWCRFRRRVLRPGEAGGHGGPACGAGEIL